ncbi:MAG: response regulator transcription factor [Flavobacteriales bacterium]|nr:response regulator transcription factor [Flavobacteriales bacterium]
MKVKALIVDDEFHCRENLQQLINEFVPELEIVALASNAEEARISISQLKPQILFLDIKMPQENGFELLRSLGEHSMSVIFTTAHNEFALEAIKVEAVDYLEKPINIEDLQSAVKRAMSRMKTGQQNWKQLLSKIDNAGKHKVSIPTKDGFVFVGTDEIIHLEASDSYTYIYLTNERKHLSSKNIKVFEDQLSDNEFYRIHKSHIINMRHHLKEFSRSEGNLVRLSEGRTAPVSRRKLSDFLSRINTYANVA